MCAVRADERRKSLLGTPEYVAPEVLLKSGHGVEVDWWAWGVIVHEMVHGLGQLPFMGETQLKLFTAIISQPLALPSGLSIGLQSIFEGCLQKVCQLGYMHAVWSPCF